MPYADVLTTELNSRYFPSFSFKESFDQERLDHVCFITNELNKNPDPENQINLGYMFDSGEIKNICLETSQCGGIISSSKLTNNTSKTAIGNISIHVVPLYFEKVLDANSNQVVNIYNFNTSSKYNIDSVASALTEYFEERDFTVNIFNFSLYRQCAELGCFEEAIELLTKLQLSVPGENKTYGDLLRENFTNSIDSNTNSSHQISVSAEEFVEQANINLFTLFLTHMERFDIFEKSFYSRKAEILSENKSVPLIENNNNSPEIVYRNINGLLGEAEIDTCIESRGFNFDYKPLIQNRRSLFSFINCRNKHSVIFEEFKKSLETRIQEAESDANNLEPDNSTDSYFNTPEPSTTSTYQAFNAIFGNKPTPKSDKFRKRVTENNLNRPNTPDRAI